MSLKNILLIGLTSILFSGCFATTSRSLDTHNLMDKFEIDKNFINSAEYVYEMLENCKSNNLLTNEKKLFPTLGKAEVNTFGQITIFGGTNYWWNINFEKINDKKTSVIIYSYMNTENTRDRVYTIKNWLLNNSKNCDKNPF
jgi:hypothetical protein